MKRFQTGKQTGKRAAVHDAVGPFNGRYESKWHSRCGSVFQLGEGNSTNEATTCKTCLRCKHKQNASDLASIDRQKQVVGLLPKQDMTSIIARVKEHEIWLNPPAKDSGKPLIPANRDGSCSEHCRDVDYLATVGMLISVEENIWYTWANAPAQGCEYPDASGSAGGEK